MDRWPSTLMQVGGRTVLHLTTGSKIQRCPTIPVQVTFELTVLGARLTHVVKHLAGGPPAHRETIKESRVVGDTANVGRMIH